jgi:hypothetical protein
MHLTWGRSRNFIRAPALAKSLGSFRFWFHKTANNFTNYDWRELDDSHRIRLVLLSCCNRPQSVINRNMQIGLRCLSQLRDDSIIASLGSVNIVKRFLSPGETRPILTDLKIKGSVLSLLCSFIKLSRSFEVISMPTLHFLYGRSVVK